MPEVGGGRVSDIEQGCFKIESEVCKWWPEAQHVTMRCLPRNLLSHFQTEARGISEIAHLTAT